MAVAQLCNITLDTLVAHAIDILGGEAPFPGLDLQRVLEWTLKIVQETKLAVDECAMVKSN